MNNTTDYINSTKYEELVTKLKELVSIHDDLTLKAQASRDLRYANVDVDLAREDGSLAADEVFVPQHIIHTNIQREQPGYIQYITQSPRAVILEDEFDPNIDLSILEKDLSKKLRFPGWQIGAYSNIDSFETHGYSIMETVYDDNTPGHISREHLQYEDFAFLSDTKDLQAVEMTSRKYYFTRTNLLALVGDGPDDFNKDQIDKIVEQEPSQDAYTVTSYSTKDASLFRIYKNMFRVGGVVYVAWSKSDICDGWLREPKPLYVGRREPAKTAIGSIKAALTGIPESKNALETSYPYFLYPYSISEDSTIGNLKGRVFLDQDIQEAVTSITTSLVTKLRRSSGLYFSKEDSDPNSSILQDKNISFKTGAILNGKIKEMELSAPDPGLFAVVGQMIANNQNETSQVNFAVANRKDSRKTATEMNVATQQAQQLSTVQVVLFSIALKEQYTYECEIIKSRVLSGLIKVNPQVLPLYSRSFIVKPAGDTDVIERQQMISLMQQAWPVIQQSPLAQAFFVDLVKLMFPNQAGQYSMILAQAAQQQAAQAQSQQAQQTQQMMGLLQQAAAEVTNLAKHKEFFSETGQVNIYPQIQMAAEKVKQMEKGMKQ